LDQAGNLLPLTPPWSEPEDYPDLVAATADGRYLVVHNGRSQDGLNLSLERLGADGTVDTSFAPLPLAIGNRHESLTALPDGRFYLATRSEIRRFNADGVPDPGFAL